ncbi:UbiA prenyltransferase [Fibrella aestuarina BUZ 2]|uniref:UbiA prenyltransferase n=1 Tax=Fibrella aestuarina BUZ 2 TaxID=1166018 RepID=I0K4K5_9BACT|nr:geranylgeranylglycerol-phosphate geranylgeranyltransferase [Fibrella aestuarina]CCG99058.1 UbiA prenyltransferase [Fibrella aestuarina BUZ 2]
MTRPIPFSEFVKGFLRLVRVQNLLIVVGTQYLARVALIGPRSDWPRILLEPQLFILTLSTVCIAAAGYIINDYFDVKIDIINKPERVVIGRYLKRRWAITLHQVLNVVGCLLGLLLSRWVFVVDVLSVSLLWFYSANLKRQPFIGNLVVAFLTALSLIVLAVYYRQRVDLLMVYASFSFIVTLVREIIKDMEDIRGDARYGCRTLPIIWGLRRTKYLLYIIIASFIMTLFLMADSLNNPRLGWIFMLLLIPVAWLVYRLVMADTRRNFAYLSNLCKLIMMMGVLSMVWA